MPVPWDYFPPRCQGPRPSVIQGPPTTSSSGLPPSASAVQSFSLPDLEADSALEDEIDGFNFAQADFPLVTDGANPGISPFNPSGIGTISSASSAFHDQLSSYHGISRFSTALTSAMHSSTPRLVDQFDKLGIDDNLTSEELTLESGDLRSRGLSARQQPSGRNTLQDITEGAEPGVTLDLPRGITSPPELPVENNLVSRDDDSDQLNSDGYAIWFNIDSDGDTPLLLAIIHQATEQALQMIRSVPSPELLDHRNHLQQSALHLAVLTHQPAVVRALVVTGTALDTRDRNGNTALHLCCKQGDMDSASALTTPIETNERIPLPFYVPHRQIPQEMSILNYDGESCLHVAANSGHLTIVEYLLSRRHIQANPNIADGKSGRTILHYAVEARDVPLVLFLMARTDVKVDCRTFDGTTALGLAVGRQYMDIANLLITAGANSDLVNLSDSDSDCDCAFMEEETN